MIHSHDNTRPQDYLSDNVLDTVSRFAPRRWRETNSTRGHYMMACPLPDHDDWDEDGGSFSVDATGQLWKCFGCGEGGNAYQLKRILAGQEQRGTRVQAPPQPGPKSPRKHDGRPELQGITIAQLAAAKGLDAVYVRDNLGWQDIRYFGVPAISIPYPDENGGDRQKRYRVGLDKEPRFRWKAGSQLRPYGLWMSDLIAEAGLVIFVEGETDFATLAYHGYPVQGIPGASNWKKEWKDRYYTTVPKQYVWQEPGVAGAKFAAKMAESFPEIRVIEAPPEAKDPTELAVLAREGFRERFDELLVRSVVIAIAPLTTLRTNPYDEAEELTALFPTPLGDDGYPVRPAMRNMAMVRRDNPRRGASHLGVSNTWVNPTNRVYKLRRLFSFFRGAFLRHLAGGGVIYQHTLTVPMATPDDDELLQAEKREWARIRRRFIRSGSSDDSGDASDGSDVGDVFEPEGALFRWFSTETADGAARVIFSTVPAYDGQSPLSNPVEALLETLANVRPLREPYPRRDAHGGADDAWRPPTVSTGQWKVVAHRPAYAITEMGQEMYDEAEAVANGVLTWRASTAEVNGRNPEVILETRHYEAPEDKPIDCLLTLWESLGFELVPKARAWCLEWGNPDAAPVDAEEWAI